MSVLLLFHKAGISVTDSSVCVKPLILVLMAKTHRGLAGYFKCCLDWRTALLLQSSFPPWGWDAPRQNGIGKNKQVFIWHFANLCLFSLWNSWWFCLFRPLKNTQIGAHRHVQPEGGGHKWTLLHLKGVINQNVLAPLRVCSYFTDLRSLWIMFLWVVQEGRHVVVQISLETMDQVPEHSTSQLVKDFTIKQ